MFKTCPSFTDYISKINSTHDAKHIDVVIPIYNLVEYSDTATIQRHLEVYGNIIDINQL